MLSCLPVLLLLHVCTAMNGHQGYCPIFNPEDGGSMFPQNVALDNSSLAPGITLVRAVSPPCACSEGTCTCCTGFILAQLGYNTQQRGCMNVTYDPDDFTFTVILGINDRVLYKNTLSGKNPEPVCISVPRAPSIKLCAVFSNVYFTGRNLHMCVDMAGQWMGASVFEVSYNCIRIGVNGVALLKPEDGGGLPHGTFVTGDNEDYDDLEDEYL